MPGISTQTIQQQRRQLFTSLYKTAFPVVARYIARMGGSFDEAKDVFQDALVAYYERSVDPSSALNNDVGYLIGIAKNLWVKRYRQKSLHISLDNFEISEEDHESPSHNRLMRFLETAGKKCMDLLTGFYYDKRPLAEMADEFGYSGTRSATVQKYKCLEKVRETVKQKALVYDDFME
ncbi:MAG: sigma-70 family RNA polymerase sigma factor [Bacteroidota bacterium]